MTTIVLLTLWLAVAMLAAIAYSFGAAIGHRRAIEEAREEVRPRQAPSGPYWPLASQRRAVPRGRRRA